MTEKEMWEAFTAKEKIKETDYEAWSFGGAPDQLAQLVVEGIKTATCSLKYWYDIEKEPLPKEGAYSVILNERNEAVCIIQTTKVYDCPYNEVTAQHAYKEGERDRSLLSWQQIHYEYFNEELKETGISFTEDMILVCEEFKVVYK